MVTLSLNGSWKMKQTTEDHWLDAIVPGSVFADLIRAGKLDDPFYRDNEDQTLALSYNDYEYEREFEVTPDLLACDQVVLSCEGLDTLADIRINGSLIASTDNMHRTYTFDVKPLLTAGVNRIHVLFRSPSKYVEEKQKENWIWGARESLDGFPHLRKAHYMFGWDWGPKLPDSGIWRNIEIRGYTHGRLDDIYVIQSHQDQRVDLTIQVQASAWDTANLETEVSLYAPNGDKLASSTLPVENGKKAEIRFTVENPQLWWPNGYGDQPLYRVETSLRSGSEILKTDNKKIGLRTIRIRREKDQWGESFEFVVNGTAIFMMGANYIPEDNILSRCSPEKTEKLIQDSIAANFNCIRVWGGGIYPEDYFFDLCDQYGLVVWQDFMFACGVYELTDEFADNVREEAIDNILRIRHHASLGLWCGNNEMEMGWVHWDFPKTPKHRTDYIKMFEVIVPEIVKAYDPQTFYWPSSPSSGGGFDKPNDESAGDVHYWDVWHGLKPFTEYRKFYFRFCSEFGFQSFPSLKTVESYTLPEDRNIFSYVMEKHQKNNAANGKILYYLSENFLYPKDFDSLLYASQLLQAEAIKYGVEHWRRNRGRSMGSIYWQLNDCWPVASWSSIDSLGRWKALHYFVKRFYAPVLLSAKEEGKTAELVVTNDTMNPVSGTVHWKLRNNSGQVLKSGQVPVSVDELQAKPAVFLDFADTMTDAMMRSVYLDFYLDVNGEQVSGSTVLFCQPKHFNLLEPGISWQISEEKDAFVLRFQTETYAKYVEVELAQADGRFSDNYFDLSAGVEKEIRLAKSSLSRAYTLLELKQDLQVRSLFDIA